MNKTYQKISEQGPPPVNPEAKKSVLERIKMVYPSAIADKVSGIEAAKVVFKDKIVKFFIDTNTKAQRYFQYSLDGKTITKRGNWEIVDGKLKYVEPGTQVTPEPEPQKTPEPVKEPTPEPEPKKTTIPKKKTSPYKRCENAPLQTKYCVSELIKKVQICLKEAGHDLGNSGVQRDGVDGYWGDKTDAALRTYGFGSGIDKQAVEVICSTVDRIKRERVQKQLKDKADQEYQQKYGGMERAAEVDYLYFGGENAGGGDEEASGEGMEGETLFFN